MGSVSERQLTYRDLVSWNIIDILERESKNGSVSIRRLYDVDPVKDTSINSILSRLMKNRIIRKSAGSKGVEVINPLMLAALKAKIESESVHSGMSIVHDSRGIWES